MSDESGCGCGPAAGGGGVTARVEACVPTGYGGDVTREDVAALLDVVPEGTSMQLTKGDGLDGGSLCATWEETR